MKNISKLIPIVAAMALLLIAFSAPVSAGRGDGRRSAGMAPLVCGQLE